MKEGTLSDRLARFLFSYRQIPQTTTGTSPAKLLLGRPLRSRLDLVRPDLSASVRDKQEKQKLQHNGHTASRKLEVGDLVYARNFGQGSPWLPGHIVN